MLDPLLLISLLLVPVRRRFPERPTVAREKRRHHAGEVTNNVMQLPRIRLNNTAQPPPRQCLKRLRCCTLDPLLPDGSTRHRAARQPIATGATPRLLPRAGAQRRRDRAAIAHD